MAFTQVFWIQPFVYENRLEFSMVKLKCQVCGAREASYAFEKQGYNFIRCLQCRHQQLHPIPSEQALDEVYQQGFGRARDGNEKARCFAESATGEYPLQVFRQMNLDRESVILDVGCSFGYDLFAFREKNQCPHVYGVEISAAARKIAREALNIEVHPSVDSLAHLGLKFDFIFLKHNLEHHRIPLESLQTIWRVLKPGGVVLVGVPNRRSINGFWGKRWEWVTPPIHIHYYSQESLNYLLNKVGLRPLWTKTRQGHGLPFLKHLLFFSPVLGQWVRRIWGDPYNPESAPHPISRRWVEWLSRFTEVFFRSVFFPLRTLLGLGEELWVLSQKPIKS